VRTISWLDLAWRSGAGGLPRAQCLAFRSQGCHTALAAALAAQSTCLKPVDRSLAALPLLTSEQILNLLPHVTPLPSSTLIET